MLTFTEHRQLYMVEMSQQIGEVDFNFTKHFLERMKVRLGNTTMSTDEMIEYLRPILANVVKKLGELPVVGEFLFYSKKLGHGIVAAWDAYKRKMHLITFLPKDRHQATAGTQEVVIESKLYTMILLDEENVRWDRPNLDSELGEYFENSFTKRFLKKYGIEFRTNSGLKDFLANGKLVNMSKEELSKKAKNITLDDQEFDNELADPEYKKSYDTMQDAKKLPAPIIIKLSDGTYYGFAGNRRINTAFRKNIPLKVWLINA